MKYGTLVEMAKVALPEKYIEDGDLNLAFGHHVRAHYVPGLGAPSGNIREYVTAAMSIDNTVFDKVADELERIADIRKEYESRPEEVIGAICEVNGINHRKVEAGLKKLKPEDIAKVEAILVETTDYASVEELPY